MQSKFYYPWCSAAKAMHVPQLRPEPSVTIPCLETNPSCQDMAVHRQPKLSTRVSSSYMWFHIAQSLKWP